MFFPLFFLPSSWKCFIYVGGVGGHLNHLMAENYTCNLSQRSSTEKQKNSSRSAEKIVVNHPQPLHLGRFTMCTRPFYNSSKHEGWKGQMMEKHRLVLYFSSTEWKVRWIISFVCFFFLFFRVLEASDAASPEDCVASSTLHSLSGNDDS